MHALRRMWQVLAGLGLTLFLIGFVPATAVALPHNPGAKQPFRLFAKAIAGMGVNRVQFGINAIGEVMVDSTGAGTAEGGFWPRGSADNYVFNSGLQVAGVIQGVKSPSNPWGGDTAGGWFFDGAGGRQQTEAVTQIYQASNPVDIANWPADAFVPQGDEVANIYAPALQGLKSASQGDAHFIAWEGNPAFNLARTHPLGILVDYRVLAWNYPAGAQDIVFLVATVYNVTSANAADYAQHRPGIRPILEAQGQKFQALNNAKFGVTLPQGGYTIGPMYMAMAADNDVGSVGENYNGVFLPFAMEYTYDGPFANNAGGWTFDPSIFSAPFFAGSGFVGYKYLKGPDGPGAIQLATTFCNGDCGGTTGHADPGSTIINFRLLAGTPISTDGQCNVTSPGKTQAQIHVCFMLFGSKGADTRMAESSPPLALAPGQAKSIVVAYIFAPPVAIPGFTPNGLNTDPGNVTWSNSGDSMAVHGGLNKIDSITGFLKYNGPTFNTDGSDHTPLQTEFSVLKGSLLGKALVAQALFDTQFLQEFAPDPPQFFLIPGDKQVTVLWKPSPTETTGDPFFQVVGQPTKVVNGQTVPNPLYDPNYRKFDVEGYRVYRGRSDQPNALELLTQFDYAGTTFSDFTGVVINGNCAPELGILTDCPVTFPTPANPVPPGTAFTVHFDYNIGPQPSGSPLIFADLGAAGAPRVALAGGTTSLTVFADTVVSGAQDGGFPKLADTGVPFIFVDKAGAPGCPKCGVNNGINYFYSVTAFDVNAPGHGPTSLESAKLTHQVTPGAPAPNTVSTGNLVVTGPNGRSGVLTDSIVPTLDKTTGKFSKRFPPSNALSAVLAGFVTQVLSAGTVTVQVDSIVLNTAGGAFTTGLTLATEWMSVNGPTGKTVFSLPLQIPLGDNSDNVAFTTVPGVLVDSALSTRFGGGKGFSIPLTVTLHSLGGYWTGIIGRSCINSGTGFSGRQCQYNGPRWFIGDTETVSNPNSDNPDFFDGNGSQVTFNNSGGLAGVVKLWRPVEYFNTAPSWRDFGGAMSPFIGDADYRMYWGSGGKVDSVIDLTHNTVVPFDAGIKSSWGILNASAVPAAGTFDARPELTFTDISCVSTFKAQAQLQSILPCSAAAVPLSQTAVPGPIVICAVGTNYGCNRNAAAEPNSGFLLYLKGHVFMFELTSGTVPAAGTKWTMRDYTGAIQGGNGNAGQYGDYSFTASPIRPATAIGMSFTFAVNTVNQSNLATAADVAKVHTVPDPYYVTSAFETSIIQKDIQFVNVPIGATIRIYSSSGVLLRVLQNNSSLLSGIVHWDVRNRTNQFVASGVYFYNVEANGVSHTGRMTIVNYASTVQ